MFGLLFRNQYQKQTPYNQNQKQTPYMRQNYPPIFRFTPCEKFILDLLPSVLTIVNLR